MYRGKSHITNRFMQSEERKKGEIFTTANKHYGRKGAGVIGFIPEEATLALSLNDRAEVRR